MVSGHNRRTPAAETKYFILHIEIKTNSQQQQQLLLLLLRILQLQLLLLQTVILLLSHGFKVGLGFMAYQSLKVIQCQILFIHIY